MAFKMQRGIGYMLYYLKTFFKINCYKSIIILVSSILSFCLYFNAEAVVDEYNKAKIELNQLMQNEKKAKYRHNWIELADTFYTIYINNKDWTNRAAALFRSAKALEQMAYRSFVRTDAKQAIIRYELLVKTFPTSTLADDSLYQAACIYSELLQDNANAKILLTTIEEKYSKEDNAIKAKEYLNKLNGNAVASISQNPIIRKNDDKIDLTKISAKFRNNIVRIVLSTKTYTSWRAKYFVTEENEPAILVTLTGTKPGSNLSLENIFSNTGIFKSYKITYNPVTSKSTILLHFSDLLQYSVKAEKEPARLIIEATNSTKEIKNSIGVKRPIKKEEKPKEPEKKELSEEEKEILDKFLSVKFNSIIKTIVIDPGHGGKDPGAVYNGTMEKDINLDVSKRLANVLRVAGYTVHLTRTEDKFLSLEERPQIAKKHKADLFISIHTNANPKKHIHGFETYYLKYKNKKDIQTSTLERFGIEYSQLVDDDKTKLNKIINHYVGESKKLAKNIQKNALSLTKKRGYTVFNGKSQEAAFVVLIGHTIPSVLVEIGYNSNPTEAKRLSKSAYRDSLAEGIANGLHQYADAIYQASK